jgi:uncharacterized protein YjbI with pentapeptide repeats
MTTRWNLISTIWKDNRWLYVVSGLFLGVLIAPAIQQITDNLNDLIGNLVPEAVGIVFTVLILDRLAENRSKEELKTRLLQEVKSSTNGIAVNALDWLRHENWITQDTFKGQSMINVDWAGAYVGDLNLEDANLAGANFEKVSTVVVNGNETTYHSINLSRANLKKANLFATDLRVANLQGANLVLSNLRATDLSEADISDADLMSANLIAANLKAANLTSANLENANLSGAYLWLANLTNTNLKSANLRSVSLFEANLKGTNLLFANLRDANLNNAIFDEKTVLPDLQPSGTFDENSEPVDLKYWTHETDMTRYTNPNHPHFWQPPYLYRDWEPRPLWITDDMLTN